jgi:hypothetical protein
MSLLSQTTLHSDSEQFSLEVCPFLSQLPIRSKRTVNVRPFRGFSQVFCLIYIRTNVREGSAQKNTTISI